MEIRRVQVTGGASFVVTLPKEWAEGHKIRKNDPVGMTIQPDGTLLISKDTTDKILQQTKEIDCNTIGDPAFLFRLLIGTYIMGFNVIQLTSRKGFPPFVRSVVRDFTQMTIGQEVVEETETVIVIKDLLDPVEMPFDNTIKRMFVIVKNMHKDAITALENRNKTLAEDVIKRDIDSDRLNWLIARQTNMIMLHSSLSRKMGVSPDMAMHYHILSRIIERVGDHAVRIAEHAIPIMETPLDKKTLAVIIKASSMSLEIFDRSIVSFFNLDLREANRNIESINILKNLCGEIHMLELEQNTLVAISLNYITESIRRAGEYAGDISETVINLLVEQEDTSRKKK
jgi:phosphate uptake regulator